jgi:hypothetical protein
VDRLKKEGTLRTGNAVPSEDDAHVRSQAAGTIQDRPQQQQPAAAWRLRLDRIDGESALVVVDGEDARSSEALIRLVSVDGCWLVAEEMWWCICRKLLNCMPCCRFRPSSYISRNAQQSGLSMRLFITVLLFCWLLVVGFATHLLFRT